MIHSLKSSEPARTGKRIIFIQEDNGIIFGPFVEHRPQSEDENTFMTAHGIVLEASLIEKELSDNVGRVTGADFGDTAAPTFFRTTKAQLAAGVRALLLGPMTEAIRCCLWLEKQTDAEFRAWFGLTVNQTTALRNQLTNLKAGVDAARTALGNIRSAL